MKTQIKSMTALLLISLMRAHAVESFETARRMALLQSDFNVTEPKSIISSSPQCVKLGGAQLSGSSKCFFISDTPGTWHEGEERCRALGGNLASIATAQENSHVYNLYKRSGSRAHGGVWIGWSDAYTDGLGVFRWSDGTAPTFTNWDIEQSEDFHQHCAQMSMDDDSWQDQQCTIKQRFVCAVHTDPTCDELDGVWRDGKCFFFGSTSGTWNEGESFCKSAGGHLASVASAMENDIVHGLYERSWAPHTHGAMWIGGRNDLATGAFSWSDGILISHANWSPEPSGQEECVTVRDDGKMESRPCTSVLPFACSRFTGLVTIPRDLPAVLRLQARCEKLSGMQLPNSTKCFFVPDIGALEWKTGENHCRSLGGHLASIASEDENSVVQRLQQQHGISRSWIGLSDFTILGEGEFRWTDGTDSLYEGWASGQPNNWKGQHCASMSANDGVWWDDECDAQVPFVCEIDTNPSCDLVGGVWSHGLCFFVPQENGGAFTGTWTQSESRCEGAGGHLASVVSPLENDIVYALLQQSKAEGIWIGASYQGQEAMWGWSDGTNVSFWDWAQVETNNQPVGGQCALVGAHDGGEWDAASCESEFPAVCAVGQRREAPEPVELRRTYSCESDLDGVELGGNCYFVAQGGGRTWHEGEQTCRTYGGNLASFDSRQQKNDVQRNLLSWSHAYWIGFNDLESEGNWKWSDGRQRDFLAWFPNEPNNYDGNEHCAEMSRKFWNDQRCDNKRFALCSFVVSLQ